MKASNPIEKNARVIFSIEIILVSKNLKESNPIGKKCKGQMPEFNIFRFDSRIFIYYIDGWRCGTPNKIVSSDDYIGQF